MGNKKSTILSGIALASVAALSACGGTNADNGKNSTEAGVCPSEITLGLQTSFALPYDVALDQGFFDDAGIESIEKTLFTSVPPMLTAVDSGQVMMGAQSIPGITSFNRQEDDQALVACETWGVDFITILAGSDSGIKSAADVGWEEAITSWEGKSLGVPALGGIVHKQLVYIIELAGLDPSSDLEIVPIGAGGPAVAAFEEGLVDIVANEAITAATMELQGLGNQVLVLSEGEGPEEVRNTMPTLFFTSVESMAKQPACYEAIAEGI